MDLRTSEQMTIHNTLRARVDVDRLYVSRREGGRGLVSIGDSVDTLIQRLEDYIQKRRERHYQLYKHICMQNQRHNKDERHSLLEKYTSHFIERVVCERELETEQNCNILTPTLLAIAAFLFRSPGLLNREPGGPASLGAGFLYRILSTTRLIPNWLIGGLRASSAGCWLSLPHLVSDSYDLQTGLISNSSDLQTLNRGPSAGCWLSLPHLVSNWLNFLCTELYNSSTSTLWTSQIALINPSTVEVKLCYLSTGCTYYLHRCISYFDSPAGS